MPDGRRLHCTTFAPSAPRAVAVFVPAAGLDVNVYVPLIVAIARTGVQIVLPLPDEGEYGRTATALRHVEDLLALTDATRLAYPHLPLFVGAHSAGCSLAWRALRERRGEVDGAFLIAPRSMTIGFARRTLRPKRAPGFLAAAWRRCRDGWKGRRRMLDDDCDAAATLPEERQLSMFVAVPDADEHPPRHPNASALRAAFREAPDCTIVPVPTGGDADILQSAARTVPRWLASHRVLQASYAA